MLNFNMDDLMAALQLMGQGLLGIFAVMAVISLFVIRELTRRWKKEVSHDSEE